ncbi:DUF6519 domain-containing protein [Nostoc piscinale]|uniref:DUF6519 domain-containing protein n=1 Tax=Nostoc piscinale TaxID=224012 RepID=UPI0007814014|nr:DUF6519 domain-containing protein [Nostoc piscinale]
MSDITKSTFDPRKHYSSVRMQQGRVQMDADWNEAQDIATYLDETTRIDVIGRCGVPKGAPGFAMQVDGDSLIIAPGRCYVDGILCENEAENPVDITAQTDLPDYELPTEPGIYLAYLDVWQRPITAIEDPEIKEIALVGPDTATRLKTIWQVKLEQVTNPDDSTPECADFEDWLPSNAQGNSQLKARSTPNPDENRPCLVPAQAGYRRLENQLYRVEIHQGGAAGTATFKWSRDNGSIVTEWLAPDTPNTDTLVVRSIGRDAVLRFATDQWVELLDDTRELYQQPGTLIQLARAGGDQLELRGNASRSDFPRTPKVKRWDHQETIATNLDGSTTELELIDGAIPVQEGAWIALEDGVEVWFEPGGNYLTGDHWLIPARTIGQDVLWNRDDSGNPLLEPPHGIIHHYCHLALLELDNAGSWEVLQDCRPEFPPLTDLSDRGCCIRVRPGDNVQQAINRAIAVGGGCICLGHGVHRVNGVLNLTNAHHINISGESDVTTLELIGTTESGLGGIVLQNASHIELEHLLIVGENTPALIQTRQDEDRPASQVLQIRHATLVNLSSLNSDNNEFTCALKLTHIEDVVLEKCRIVADIGILGLIGDRLPAAPETKGNSPTINRIDFSGVAVGTTYRVGETFPAPSGVTVTAREFQWSNGQNTSNGFARIDAGNRAGGTSPELQCNNINFQFEFAAPPNQVTVRFADFGGNVNLSINGVFRNLGDLVEVNGQSIGGVQVSVTPGRVGLLTLTGAISRFAVGGQEFWIDNVQFGETQPEPPPTVYPGGITKLQLDHVGIRYRFYGIWTIQALDWQIEHCDLRPLLSPRPRPDGSFNTFDSFLAIDLGNGNKLSVYRQLIAQLDELFLTPSNTNFGTAIKAVIWQNCKLRDSHLQGDIAIYINWSFASDAIANQIQAQSQGLQVFWLHQGRWEANRVTCSGGAALSFAGSYRTLITGNRITNSRIGITNFLLPQAIEDILSTVQEITFFYGNDDDDASLLAVWLLLTRLIGRWDLQTVVNRVQSVLYRTNLNFPALYLLANYLYSYLSNSQNRRNWPLPIIALQIRENDIEARDFCIRLTEFWTLGGLGITHNRLHTITGQSVLIETNFAAANVDLLVLLWRYLMAGIISVVAQLIEQWQQTATNNPNLQPVVVVVGNLLQSLQQRFIKWQQESEGFLEADYRIVANQIRSFDTAIASNIFELAILDNHITIQERQISIADANNLTTALNNVDIFAPLGLALQEGSTSDLLNIIQSFQNNATQLTTDAARRQATAALTDINNSSRINDTNLRTAASTLTTALQNPGNTSVLRDALNVFAQAILPYINSYGIFAKGAGCRIVGNHILVPADINPDTWTRGGIRLSLNLQAVMTFVLIAQAIQRQIFNDQAGFTANNPLFGVTETLIDNNEILGGIGHGIDIQGANDVPEILVKLKLRHNQISYMGGAGIFINENALVINLDVEANRISDCAQSANLANFSLAKGGIDIQGAAFCRLHNNRVNNCSSETRRRFIPAAVNLETIFDLVFTDNSIQYNPVGGVRLTNVFGTVAIADNDISQNRGVELAWGNAEPSSDFGNVTTLSKYQPQTFAPTLALALSANQLNQPIPTQLQYTQANVQGNHFHVPEGLLNISAFVIAGINSLIFTSNHASNHSTIPVGNISNIEQSVIANNLLRNL